MLESLLKSEHDWVVHYNFLTKGNKQPNVCLKKEQICKYNINILGHVSSTLRHFVPYFFNLIEYTGKKKEFLKLYIIIQNHVLQPCSLPCGSSHFTDLWFALLFKQQRDWLCVRKCPIQNVVMFFFMGILTLQVTFLLEYIYT